MPCDPRDLNDCYMKAETAFKICAYIVRSKKTSSLHAESIFVPGRACSVFSNSPTHSLAPLRIILEARHMWTSQPLETAECVPRCRESQEMGASLVLHWRTEPSTLSSLEPAQRDRSSAQPAGPGLVNIVFPAPSPFLQETPPLPQLGRCFSAYTLEPTTQAQGGVRGPTGAAQPAAPGSLSSTKRPNPQTQEKPELSQLANTQASCPSVCGRASCWRKGGLQLCSDIPGWWPGTASWHPTWAAAALLRAAVSRHSQGRWGQAVGAVKRNLREQRKL